MKELPLVEELCQTLQLTTSHTIKTWQR